MVPAPTPAPARGAERRGMDTSASVLDLQKQILLAVSHTLTDLPA